LHFSNSGQPNLANDDFPGGYRRPNMLTSVNSRPFYLLFTLLCFACFAISIRIVRFAKQRSYSLRDKTFSSSFLCCSLSAVII